MADTEITKAHWAVITDRIRAGACVPFLGAAVNVSSGDYLGLPLGEEVALRLIREIVELSGVDPADLVKVEIHPRLKQHERDRDLARVMVKNPSSAFAAPTQETTSRCIRFVGPPIEKANRVAPEQPQLITYTP